MSLDQAISALSFMGACLLAWPALHAARYALKLNQLSKIGPLDQEGKDKDIFAKLTKNLRTLQGKWNYKMHLVFIAGTASAVFSAFLSVYKSFFL